MQQYWLRQFTPLLLVLLWNSAAITTLPSYILDGYQFGDIFFNRTGDNWNNASLNPKLAKHLRMFPDTLAGEYIKKCRDVIHDGECLLNIAKQKCKKDPKAKYVMHLRSGDVANRHTGEKFRRTYGSKFIPYQCYDAMSRAAITHTLRPLVVITGHHISHLGNKSLSEMYVQNVVRLFGPDTIVRVDRHPDEDLCDMIFSDVFIKGGGGFSAAVEHVRRSFPQNNASHPDHASQPQQPQNTKHYGSNWWKSKKYKCLTLYDQPIPKGIEAQWEEVRFTLGIGTRAAKWSAALDGDEQKAIADKLALETQRAKERKAKRDAKHAREKAARDQAARDRGQAPKTATKTSKSESLTEKAKIMQKALAVAEREWAQSQLFLMKQKAEKSRAKNADVDEDEEVEVEVEDKEATTTKKKKAKAAAATAANGDGEASVPKPRKKKKVAAADVREEEEGEVVDKGTNSKKAAKNKAATATPDDEVVAPMKKKRSKTSSSSSSKGELDDEESGDASATERRARRRKRQMRKVKDDYRASGGSGAGSDVGSDGEKGGGRKRKRKVIAAD